MNDRLQKALSAGAVLGMTVSGQQAAIAASPRQQAARFHPPARIATHKPASPGAFDRPVLYAAATSTGVVNVYPGGAKPPKKILYSFNLNPGVENSLHIDGHGNVFFADSYSTWVYEYAPGTNRPLKSFPTSETPYNIDIRGDTLYVFQSNEGGGDASVQIYDNGQTQPDRSLTDGAIDDPTGMAVDGAGNVFVAYLGPNFTSGVGEFVGGKMPMVPLHLKEGILPLALAIDADVKFGPR